MLKKLRKERGWTQEDVSQKIGVRLKTYALWESGYFNPVASNLVKLADLYGVTTDYLLGREEHAQRKMHHLRENLGRERAL